MVSKLSILRSILNEAIDYRAGRDDVDAIGHVFGTKPEHVQELWFKEARFDDENRQKFYEKFGPDRFEAELEAAIVERFEGNLQA